MRRWIHCLPVTMAATAYAAQCCRPATIANPVISLHYCCGCSRGGCGPWRRFSIFVIFWRALFFLLQWRRRRRPVDPQSTDVLQAVLLPVLTVSWYCSWPSWWWVSFEGATTAIVQATASTRQLLLLLWNRFSWFAADWRLVTSRLNTSANDQWGNCQHHQRQHNDEALILTVRLPLSLF